jgi:CRP-like cAMP-binding protein
MSDPVEKTFGTGQTLFRQGEKGGELYFIKTGRVELSVRTEDGQSAVVATLGDKAVLGVMSFLEGDPRSATAKAVTEVKAVVVNEAQRERLLGSVPHWFSVLVKDLSSSLRRLNGEFAALKAEHEALKKKYDALKRRAGGDGEAKTDKAG